MLYSYSQKKIALAVKVNNDLREHEYICRNSYHKIFVLPFLFSTISFSFLIMRPGHYSKM